MKTLRHLHIKVNLQLPALLFLLVVLTLIAGCAKVGSPYGGPKDTEPPVVLKTKPPQNSTHFEPTDKIIIYFDEFVQLKDIYQEMMVSPPIEGNPIAMLRGRGIQVDIPRDAEFDSTTYTISFGNGIVDNNEGNILKNYQYIFSLKSYIDSMNVEGKVISAFDHQPDEERMLVMLYKNLNDSAPLLERPSYISRTDASGNFTIPNLETGTYRMFGLKDGNGNLMYDVGTEQIAFLDSVIELTPEKFEENLVIRDSALYDSLLAISEQDSLLPDTLDLKTRVDTQALAEIPFDSLNIAQDTLLADSLLADSLPEEEIYYSFYTEMEFFTEVVYKQYLTDYKRDKQKQLFFSFNEAPVDTIEVTPIKLDSFPQDWFVLDASDELDTLKLWLTDSSMYNRDSVWVELCYPMYDSSNLVYGQRDTLLMRYTEPQQNNQRQRRGLFQTEEEVEDTVEVIPRPQLRVGNNTGNNFELNKSIALSISTPIAELRTDSLKLFRVKDDSILIPMKYRFEVDTNSLYRVWMHFEPRSETTYQVFFPDSVVHDIYGETNDTTKFRFTTRAEDYYGAINLNLMNVTDSVIVQLMDTNEKVLKEQTVTTDGYIYFKHLHPKEYKLKVIFDRNGNGEWDTGNYLKRLQPEKVKYYPDVVNVRSNWDVDFPWKL